MLHALGLGAAAAALPEFATAAAPTFPKGAVIRTILKDYAPEDLAGGATLFHEHMSIVLGLHDAVDPARRCDTRGERAAERAGAGRGTASAAAPPAAAPSGPFFMQDVELMSEEMAIAKHEGIGCIVDGGHPDMGRDFKFLRQMSRKSGLPIVAGAGFYTQPFYPKEIGAMSEEQIVQALIKQVDADPDRRVRRDRIVGRHHEGRAQGVPRHRQGAPGDEPADLHPHRHSRQSPRSSSWTSSRTPASIRSASSSAISATSSMPTSQVHKAICRRGAFIGFDRQGGPGDAQQVPMVMALIEAGFADNLMFSADISSAGQMKRNNGQGYAKTLTVFVPKLKSRRRERRGAAADHGRQPAPVPRVRPQEAAEGLSAERYARFALRNLRAAIVRPVPSSTSDAGSGTGSTCCSSTRGPSAATRPVLPVDPMMSEAK